MELPLFDHEGPWTEAAYLALPHDGRVEVVDGTLLIGPGASPKRVRAIERVRAAVTAALPDGLMVRGPVPLRLGQDCVLVPDLVVTAAPAAPAADGEGSADEPSDEGSDGTADEATDEVADEIADKAGDEGEREDEGEDEGAGAILDAAAALMVLEVVGYDHGATDRSFKPQLYARSRIPYSLLIDYDGPFAVADMIIGGRYHEYARAGGDERLLIEEPFRLELDLPEIAASEPEPAEAGEDGEAAEEPSPEPPTERSPKRPAEAR